ncbi:MAG: DUF2877 domain-containing protein [Candidatus Rokubacteria bacterium]|nr:DUF2877 domain-containing protein [Candidatus Rokubacteria bacterium]
MPAPPQRPVVLDPLRVMRLGSASLERLARDPDKTGRVHSVFERAVNVLWRDGRLLTLHGPGPLAAPFAVALERLPTRGSVAPGMPIGSWNFDWQDAERVALEMPDGPLGFAADALPERAGAQALRSPAGARTRQAIARGIAAGDARGFADAACALIGFGEGLTPAGDDCVLGALAAVHRLAPGWLGSHAGARDRLAEAARTRTTDLARDFLLEALDGRFAEPVLALLTALSDDLAEDAAGRLLSVGATSGADTLCGIRLGCRALEARMARR